MRFTSSSALLLGISLSASVANCAAQPTTLDPGGSGGRRSAGQTSTQCSPPAEVRSVIAMCAPCHGKAGSLPRLAAPADFQASSPSGGTYAERSVTRMKESDSPMPPDGVPSSNEVSAFEAWIADGYPLTCPTTSSATTGSTSSESSTSGSATSGSTMSGSGGSGAVSP